MDDLLKRFASLSPEQRKMVLKELQKQGRAPVQVSGIKDPPIIPVPRDGRSPLSFGQQRLWFLDRLAPGNPFYNIPSAMRFTGRLDVKAAEKAINEIVRRHETLRTTFTMLDGQPVQVIAPTLRVALPVVDLSALPNAERRAEAHRLTFEAAMHPFDLTRGPLIRAAMLRLGEQEHIQLLTLHHIVSDGWSMGVLMQELATLYQAFATGAPSPLSELPIQYADFAIWQRQWLQGEVLEKQLSYWRKQLSGAPAVLDLPSDRPRPAAQSLRGTTLSFSLPLALSQALQTLSHEEGVTLFMVLLAGFKTLLYRYTGQADVVVGTPIANRTRSEIEGLIGFFVNTLVLRSDLSGQPTFRELLQRVREVTLGAYAHQDLPFEMLVEELQPERDLSRAPLCQVVFALQNAPMPSVNLPGLQLTPLDVEGQTAKFDLICALTETEHGLSGLLEYNTDLFEATTMARLIGHFQTLLEGIVSNPDERLPELSLLTQAERRQALEVWNATEAFYPSESCIHELVEERVAAAADKVAAVYEGEHLTYAALNRRANQLAHHLQGLGVGPEVLVGLCVERSLEMVVGLLGILKAGGAYVPLDPTYPKDRLAFMLDDSEASVVLTQAHLVEQISTPAAIVICLDTGWELIAQESDENSPGGVAPEGLAYVIYTSGSTGRPKGVLVPHRGLVNVAETQIRLFGLEPDDRVLQFSSLSFDAATFEFVMALRTGGTLCLGTRDSLLPGPNLSRLLQDLRVTIFTLTPSALAALPVEAFPALRTVTVAGEACPADLVSRWANEQRFFNLYGPTEGTIWATAARCIDDGRKPSIGQPIANTQVYILDTRQRPVPIGVPGEMYIGGVGVTRGYLGRPELTAETFVPDPFSARPGARLYRTGDLARYLSDGSIGFLGRIGHQVKVRGFRIELGEIESVLSQHPTVQEAVVLARDVDARKSPVKDLQLVAYVAIGDGPPLAGDELRRFLKDRLPEYMLPSVFIMLDALPLTPNGKVDQQALLGLEHARSEQEELAAPRTPTEEVLTSILTQVLGIERVGIYDNFFDLGGHSLLAAQVLSRIHQTFQVDLPLRTLFELPTIADIARSIDSARQTSLGFATLPLAPAPRDGRLPLSFAQQRLWFLDRLTPHNPLYNTPIAARLDGQFDATALERSVNEIIRRHESLRTTFATLDGQPVQVIAASLRLTLPMVDLSEWPAAECELEAQRLTLAAALRPFDLMHGPLIHGMVLRLDAQAHILLLALHHIVSDGWSMGVLVRELATLYQAFATGAPSPLEELGIQYADFAVWQRQWLQGEVLEKQLSYWRQQLSGAPAVLDLPSDRPRPAVQSLRGTTLTFNLPPQLSQALQALSRAESVTLFMTLLAGFKTLLYRYTGQADVVIGTPIANRTRSEIEGLIGFFVNTLVLRSDLSGQPTFRELLQRVREVTLGAYAHQDLPFEMLVEELQPERDLSRTPLFQIMFILQNTPMPVLSLPGLELTPLDIEGRTAKFDLICALTETEHGLSGLLEYNTDLFEATTMARLIGHFQTLLEGIVSNPDERLPELSLLTEAERRQALEVWNATEAFYPSESCIHELVEERVAAAADKVAAVYEGEHLTYAALNRRANQLAHHLQGLGVGPEVLVGLCVERSLEMVVGLLGILKAGGAYVPLDPTYPKDRLAFVLEDARTPVLLTQERLVAALPHSRTTPGEKETRIICLDSDWAAIAEASDSRPASGVRSDGLMYVIYTSGSTGQPKGAMNTHAGICNRLIWMQDAYHLTEADRILQKTPFSFDVSGWEFFWPLLTGACLVLARPEGHKDSAYLVKTVVEQSITTMHFVPSMLRVFVEERGVETCRSLLRVICSGEALPLDLQERFFTRLNAELHNLYGPTEAAIDVTYWACVPGNAGRSSVPIGRPIANTQIYVLNARQRPAPIGVPGELYIGGVGLARGYVSRPDLTAEKFVPNPFCNQPGARLYRTGDLARFLPDGNVEFLGRIDHQVKIRGFRIELGEIEAVLSQHPAVHETVVLAREAERGDKRLVAYVVPSPGLAPEIAELRSLVKDKLPEYMTPSAFVFLDAFPLSPNGKLDRRALPAPDSARPALGTTYSAPRDEAERTIAAIWQEVLGLDKVGVYDNFFDLGGHSLLVVRVHERLQAAFGVEIPLTDLFKYTTVTALAQYLCPGQAPVEQTSAKARERAVARRAPLSATDIAVIGMAGRFPGADNLDQFWANLCNGVESISHFSDQELLEAGVDPALLRRSDYVKAKGILSDPEYFDAHFFGFNPGEAEIMDPQQRLFLECAWHALENSGYTSDRYDGRIGVYAGAGLNTYILNNIYSDRSHVEAVGPFQIMLSNDEDFLATQASYRLNLKGPSFTVQTACSTSLVAVHLASQGLLNGECDMALAGGVALRAPQREGYLYEPYGIASPDGHCRPFDAQAQGTVGGSGVGLVVLKRLTDALRDGDTIHAVIKGSAINNDGARKIGYTAPSEDGQVEVITEALTLADVEPATISYVEAHGTATALGDPIEVAALTRAFRASTTAIGFCGIGSVKSNVGHLDSAAGVAGLLKTVLALEHKQLPPSLHFTTPNPQIDFSNSPFYVNTALREWQTPDGQPRRAGVSSFGIGGTNAHAIVEEAPLAQPTDAGRGEYLLALSARAEEALEEATQNLATYLNQHSAVNLADVAYTLQLGRRAFEHRRMLVCKDAPDAAQALQTLDPKRVFSAYEPVRHRPLFFMFPGQGAQYVNMGRGLYDGEPSFRATLDQCAALLQPHLGLNLLEVLYPSSDEEAAARERLDQTALTQPALFVIEYALAQLWQKWGLQPKGMIGHSIGEYVAACLAGVFTLEEALELVAQRGRLIQALPGGAMLSVPLGEQAVRTFLDGQLSLAAVNGPQLCAVSGPEEPIENLRVLLEARGVQCHRLHTSHAFHSKMMKPAANEFARYFGNLSLRPPRIPFVSNVTGTWITAEEATDPLYWARHLRQTVRFREGLKELLDEQDGVLLEVGPGRTLSMLAKQQQASAVVSSLRHPQDVQDDSTTLLTAVGRLWLSGVEVDWRGFYGDERRRRVPLPVYPFAKERYWIEPKKDASPRRDQIVKSLNVLDWFYVPYWKPGDVPAGAAEPSTWLMIGDEATLSAELAARLRAMGHTVNLVRAGKQRSRQSNHDYDKFLDSLDPLPQRVVYCANGSLDLFNLVALVQALGRRRKPTQLHFLTRNAQMVTGHELVDPVQAMALGLALVIPQEYPHLICRSIDVAASGRGKRAAREYDDVLAELTTDSREPMVAYRDGQRWVQAFEALTPSSNGHGRLHERGVYLIANGLSQIGRALARCLAETAQARLALVDCSGLPERAEWSQWLVTHEPTDSISEAIRFVQELEEQTEVIVLAADLEDREQLQAILVQTRQRFGSLHGVIHVDGAGGEDNILPLEEMTRAAYDDRVRRKLQEVKALANALKGQELDFCLLSSSLSAVLGGMGLAAHAAVSRFKDAFARRQNRTQSIPWISVNWDALRLGDGDRGSGAGAMELTISSEEAAQVFQRVLNFRHLTRVIVSTGELQARLDRWVTSIAAERTNGQAAQTTRHARPNLPTTYVAPNSVLEKTLAAIWARVLNVEHVGIHDNFYDLGGHSLLSMQIIAAAAREAGLHLTPREFLEHQTVAELAHAAESALKGQGSEQMLRQQLGVQVGANLVQIQAGGPTSPLFLVHPGGGTVLCYVMLARHMGGEQPVYGLEATGLYDDEPPLDDIPAMAARYVQAIQTVQPDGPYRLGGWSFGGLVAFEMAQQLREQGRPVSFLGLIDAILPSDTAVEEQDLRILKELIKWAEHFYAQTLNISDDDLRHLARDERMDYILEHLQRVGVNILDPECMERRRLSQVYRADTIATAHYQPRRYSGTVTLLRAKNPPQGRAEVIPNPYFDEPTMGWDQFSTEPVVVHVIPGHHEVLTEEPYVNVLAEKMQESLKLASADMVALAERAI